MLDVAGTQLTAEDRKRLSEFYTRVFGWEANQLGADMGNYVVVMTAESDEKGPKKPGAINGGIYQKTPDMPEQHPSVVISVDDIKEHMKIVEANGGKVHGEPMDIPGVGKYVPFTDTEGNRLSMLEPVKM